MQYIRVNANFDANCHDVINVCYKFDRAPGGRFEKTKGNNALLIKMIEGDETLKIDFLDRKAKYNSAISSLRGLPPRVSMDRGTHITEGSRARAVTFVFCIWLPDI